MDKKYNAPGAIDFKAMYAAEKKKKEFKIIQSNRETVFNLLQDMRHILILDLRSEEKFNENRLRNSFHFPLDKLEENEAKFLQLGKKSQEQLLDQTDDYRRLLFVTQEADEDIESIKPFMTKFPVFSKIIKLKNGFENFYEKYPFLGVNDSSSDSDIKKASSRYPSEIIPGKLFLGNFINSLNSEHFKVLNIKKLIGMTPNKAEKMEEGKQINEYIHLEMDEQQKPDLDFDQLENIVTTAMNQEDGAVLIYGLQGNLSAAVGIHMLMKEKKWNREFASVAIMQKRPEIKNIPSWLFQQIDAPKIGDVPPSALSTLFK